MITPNELVVGIDEDIHFPCNSGLRLRADDPRIAKLEGFARPVIVVESNGNFKVVASHDRLEIAQQADGVLIQSDSLYVMGSYGDLESALAGYLGQYPLPETTHRANNIKRVIILDMWLPDGEIAHTYKDAAGLTDDLARRELADGTLLYLPGWHAPYDTQYPAYAPSDELGGTDMFRRMLELADQAGVRVMPHLNFWGYDVSSGLLKDHSECQVRDEQGEPQGWPGVLTTGYTNPLAYMRVDDISWQEAFFEHVEPLLTEFQIKSLFLDQIGAWAGHSRAFDNATISILKRLRTIQPDLLLGGELIDDSLVGQIDIFHAWGQPWCGLDIDYTDSFSPIIAMMFGDKVKCMAHLGLPCAKPCRYCWTNYPFIVEHGCERAFELGQEHNRLMGGIPRVRLAYRRWGVDEQSPYCIESIFMKLDFVDPIVSKNVFRFHCHPTFDRLWDDSGI